MTTCYTSHGPVEVTKRTVKPYPHTPTGEPSESAGMPIDMIELDELGPLDDDLETDGFRAAMIVLLILIVSIISAAYSGVI